MAYVNRWPWNVVKSFKVSSLADGNLLIEPDYHNPRISDEEGGGPGLFTRLSLAEWCAKKLARRSREVEA